jgi:golgi-specific brefeldin A-resistance guanine nucleotide exchange factor 1
MFQTLFLHSLLPTRMLQTEDFLGGVSMIPMQGNASTPAPAPARSDGGLLSTLSSYLITPYGPSTEASIPEVTDGDVENTMSAIDCIAACRLHELYTQIMCVPAFVSGSCFDCWTDDSFGIETQAS